ncbi:TIGR01621 family pseudouridine synthase [Neisseria chenwenguii]|uniref:TIGR01621 family pseudouridine synthase n=1 Tax=Neisseria chenwenguii TaxID=1853278 RepID=A0A220S0Q5_9NEIS|nr:TIGR01621 family pseudouridine synthase [Neisseria chenwenguii]ASK27061.1 TIGR01621 family pseudouridine synthase [Neisseria chenwenguii]
MFEILFRNEDFVAVNKPCGVAVQQESLLPDLAAQLGVARLWLVHRLDKETSGVLLLALNAESASELAQMFTDKAVKKTYLALSDRKPSKKQGWVKGGMEKSRRGSWKLTRAAENFAVTRFQSFGLENSLRLFILEPHTGKTHQLRVAAKSLGSPLLGDSRYGGSPAPRLFLHAWKICLDRHGSTLEISAPLGKEWPSEKIKALTVPVKQLTDGIV